MLATVTLLTALTILPICYCALAIHITSCLFSNLNWVSRWCQNRDWSQDGAVVFCLSVMVKSCAAVLLFYTQTPKQLVAPFEVD